MKKGQNNRFEKGYFQGYNKKDPSMFIKFPNDLKSKSIARKSKVKRKK